MDTSCRALIQLCCRYLKRVWIASHVTPRLFMRSIKNAKVPLCHVFATLPHFLMSAFHSACKVSPAFLRSSLKGRMDHRWLYAEQCRSHLSRGHATFFSSRHFIHHIIIILFFFFFRVFLLNGIDDQVDKHRGQSCIAIQVIPSDSLGLPEPMGQGTDTSAICSLEASHTFAWKWHPHGSGRDTLPVPEVTTDDLSTSWLISPAPAAM